MTSRAQEWLSFLSDPAHPMVAREAAWIAGSDVREISMLLRDTRGLSPFSDDQINMSLLQATLEQLPQWGVFAAGKSDSLPTDLCDQIGELYIALRITPAPRHSLLTLLALLGGEKDLIFFANSSWMIRQQGVQMRRHRCYPSFDSSPPTRASSFQTFWKAWQTLI